MCWRFRRLGQSYSGGSCRTASAGASWNGVHAWRCFSVLECFWRGQPTSALRSILPAPTARHCLASSAFLSQSSSSSLICTASGRLSARVAGSRNWPQHYADVTLRDATPLLALARENAVVAQYLRCVGREGRPLLNLERIALYAWSEEGRREQIGAG